MVTLILIHWWAVWPDSAWTASMTRLYLFPAMLSGILEICRVWSVRPIVAILPISLIFRVVSVPSSRSSGNVAV